MKRISLLLVTVLAVVLAACGGAEQTTPSPTADPTPAATPETTPTPEPTDDGTDAEPTTAVPSFDLNGDPELAGRFPDTVGGQPLMVQSFRGDIFLTMGDGVDESLQEFLDSVDADLTDVSVAFGGADSGDGFLSVSAIRVLGVDQERLEQEFLGTAVEEEGYEDLSRETIGGKEVWTAEDPSGQFGGVYFYAKDDTVYWLTGTRADAEEILEALP